MSLDDPLLIADSANARLNVDHLLSHSSETHGRNRGHNYNAANLQDFHLVPTLFKDGGQNIPVAIFRQSRSDCVHLQF
jgi:hypothetical protein